MPTIPRSEPVPQSVSIVVRELTTTYQAVQSCDADHLKQYKLTPAQADVIHSLAAGRALSCRELADATLISRGSLSGVLSRLESRGLIVRAPSREDRRKILVRLTRHGMEVFRRLAPDRMSRLAERLDRLGAQRQGIIVDALRDLRNAFR